MSGVKLGGRKPDIAAAIQRAHEVRQHFCSARTALVSSSVQFLSGLTVSNIQNSSQDSHTTLFTTHTFRSFSVHAMCEEMLR